MKNIRQTDDKAMTIDKSKFLMPELNHGYNALEVFNPDKKEQFLLAYEKTFNMSASLRVVGVGKKSYYDQLGKDKAFKEAVWVVFESMLDRLEGVAYASALTAGAMGFRDRVMLLKANRPKYNDKIQHEHKVDTKQLINAYDNLPLEFKTKKAEVIDVKDQC